MRILLYVLTLIDALPSALGLKFLPIADLLDLPVARNAAYTSIGRYVFRFGGWNDVSYSPLK